MHWDVTLLRKTKNKLNPEITRKKLRKIAEAASRNRSLGFEGKVGRLVEPVPAFDEGERAECYVYKVTLRLKKAVVRSQESVHDKYQHVLKVVTRCANSEGWSVLDKDQVVNVEQEDVQSAAVSSGLVRVPFDPPPLTDAVLKTFFGDIYERDPHIRTIHDAVSTCVKTKGELLSHVILYGLPGSCKTQLVKRFKAWYEHDLPADAAERVLLTNNISTTKAGLENMLLTLAEADTLPTVLVMDEIEKQPMDNLLCLNTLMSEGVVTKLNARIGNRREAARLCIIALCNNEDKVREFQNGHLWSRFTHQLPCVRPSKDLCRFILSQEVKKIPGGREAWAEAALKFGWDELKQRDIRKLKGHLDAGDRLLNGSWQADQLAMRAAAERERANLVLEEVGA